MSVPGASGGTMAMLLGVYEGMLAALTGLFRDFRKNAGYLFLLALGGGAGIALAGGMVESFLFFHPFAAGFFFAGCIAGGIPFLLAASLKQAGRCLFGPLCALVFGAGLGVGLPLCPGLFRGEGSLYLLLAGLLLAAALVLPGISASSFLYILGLYEPLAAALRGRELAFLLPLGLGCLVGCFLVARLFTRALQKHTAASHMLITGFLISSGAASLPYGTPGDWHTALFAAALGFAPMFALSGGGKALLNLWQRRKHHAKLPHRKDGRRAGPGPASL